ncbi:MAG: PepSY domain-containing protein [Ottowia sp.]|nr:PepSY domain-containing protein [Ottowia sp.]
MCHSFLLRAVYALLAALLALSAVAVSARDEQEGVRAAVEAGRYKPLASILEQVGRDWLDARVLELDSKQGVLGQMYYEVKLLDRAGVKRTLLVDATTGRELDEGSKVQQAVSPRELAAYLRRIESESGRSVVEAELELGIDGKAAYQIVLAPSVESAQRRLMDAASGELLHIEQQQTGALHTMPEALEALAERYATAAVLEVEVEGVSGSTVYYEIDLRVDGGAHTLELHVDARTLRVLKSRYKRD